MRNRWILASLFAAVAAALLQASASAQSREGLKVHGHWTIDVKRPDGSVVSHHEFDNALVQPGQMVLTRLLTRTGTLESWSVGLFSPEDSAGTVSGPCGGPHLEGFDDPCYLFEPTLRVLNNISTVVLLGQTTADNDASIGRVHTTATVCDPERIGQTACTAEAFTRHSLKDPIRVTAGQIIQVRIEISFS